MSETEPAPVVLTVKLEMLVNPPQGVTVESVNHSSISVADDGRVLIEVAYYVAHDA